MTGRRVGTLVGHAALGLATTAAVLVLAPSVAASPEGDADHACTAAWEAAGGEKSVLGAKQGDVYAVGAGFVQDFAGGKMFFTPATGAKSMYGAVLDKYEALGGPAGSDLGFPTINEVPGLAGPDSRASTFSASDKPVIFWTPDHGAFVVRGAINAAWDQLGSSGGALGVPVGEETYQGEVTSQPFSGGQVSWNRLTKTFTTVPPDLAQRLAGLSVPIDATASINLAWRSAGGASGPLGAKQGGQSPIGGDGIVQAFTGGKVFFSPATGANAVESDILAKYESLGGPTGDLGFPIANETDGGVKPTSRISTFSGDNQPVIFWTPNHGAFLVTGAMKAAWDKLGGATGKLGAPIGDQTTDKTVLTQKFTGGKVSWDKAKNRFSTEPANLASSLSGLRIPGQNLPSTSAAPPAPAPKKGFHWQPSWLLFAVPALLLVIGIGAFAVLWSGRRRRRAGADTSALEAHRDLDVDYEPAAGGEWSADADSDLESPPFHPSYPEPSRDASLDAPEQPRPRVSWMRGADIAAGLAESNPAYEPLTTEAPLDIDDDIDIHERVNFGEDIDFGEDVDFVERADFGERHDFGEDVDFVERVDFVEDFGQGVDVEDPDAVDTAPTRIPSAIEVSGGRHAAADAAADVDEGSPVEVVAPPPSLGAQPMLHLPLDDPFQMPDGYPIKGLASSGLYYTPESDLYEETLAEIWFASEDVARANGFVEAL